MRSGIGTWPLCVALAAVGCGEGGGVTQPPTPTPQATPLGTFAIVSASPAFGGTVSGSQSDLQGGTSGLAVTFQMTYTQSISDVYCTLIDPATNQLRTLFAQDASGGWTFAFAR